MPKIVDHEKRRDEIALIACRVVAQHGFEQATIVRIARAAGCTTGMIAHYFDTKQEIIVAALRLILRRIEERLTQAQGTADLLALLSEALPIGYVLTVGNQTRLAAEELIEHLCADERVTAFGLYLEGIRDMGETLPS